MLPMQRRRLLPARMEEARRGVRVGELMERAEQTMMLLCMEMQRLRHIGNVRRLRRGLRLLCSMRRWWA